MADFTSWSAMLTDLKNKIANRDLAVHSYRTPDGTFVQYRTIEEMFAAIGEIEARIEADSATSGKPSRRCHTAIQGDFK